MFELRIIVVGDMIYLYIVVRKKVRKRQVVGFNGKNPGAYLVLSSSSVCVITVNWTSLLKKQSSSSPCRVLLRCTHSHHKQRVLSPLPSPTTLLPTSASSPSRSHFSTLPNPTPNFSLFPQKPRFWRSEIAPPSPPSPRRSSERDALIRTLTESSELSATSSPSPVLASTLISFPLRMLTRLDLFRLSNQY